jgi:hypothetical protein
LEFSEFFVKSVDLLTKDIGINPVEEIICLGIGKISECAIAKHQLAFILIVRDKFKVQSAKFFDPAHSNSDKNVLKSLECEILAENKEGKYQATKRTLFYLPHCAKQITNNLLFVNWNAQSLKNLVLVCNSFKSIVESSPERLLRPNAHYLLEVSSLASESEIDNCFKYTDIFNDFSIHTFPANKLVEADSSFWENHSEPVYSSEELEFVKEDGSSQDAERNSK